MVQSAFLESISNKNNVLKYTTVTGIKGFKNGCYSIVTKKRIDKV